MSDVTCKAVHTLLDVAEERGVDPQLIAATSPYSLEFLREKNNRISWAEYVAIGKSTRELCNLSDNDLEAVGSGAFKSGPLRVVMSLGRVLGDPAKFYKWMQKGNAMLFANMTSSVEVHSKHHLSIRIRLREQDEQSDVYLLISKGAIASMPTLLGYPEAKVVLQMRGPEAVFDVTMQSKRRSFARRAFQAIQGSEETANELLATNEALTRRLTELSTANEQIKAQATLLDQQATRLRLANEVAALIHGTHDAQETLDRIAATLLSNTSAVAAQLEVRVSQNAVPLHAVKGTLTKHRLSSPITVRGTELGSLDLCVSSDDKLADLSASLEYVLPVLGMAIDDAIAYRELAEYKAGLEKLVDERTIELRHARDQLAGTVAQLRDAQEAREKFFGNISHEIRTPLALILLAAADVDRRAGHLLDDRARGNLGAVNDAARKLVRLVDELLLLAAGQADKLRLAREPIDLRTLFDHLVAAWRPAAEAAGLTLESTLPETLFANVDPVAIERVVSNLLSNAVKYTPRGGRIDLELVADQQEVRISVLDTGPGIDADLAARLFGRFERAGGDDRRKSGTGIGLALVRQLVEAHDGTVTARPRDVQGIEFRIVLPASAIIREGVTVAPATLKTTHGPGVTVTIESGAVFAPAGTSSGTILIAEDEPQLARAIAELLAEQYTVVVALDGSAALELVKKHQPQLLITDVEMPGMNGIELSRRFREITGDRLAPIVILSAVIDMRTRVAGLEAGAVDYVSKPFDPTELSARVHAQFRMRDLALRLHRAEQLSALGILTAGLAHELRNPANGIVNAIPPLRDMLPRELAGPDTGPGELLDVMKGCADQIGFLTRQLLGFRNNMDLELRPASLSDLVQRAVNLANGALHQVDVRTNSVSNGTVMCAPPLLVQALTNLIENAGHAAGPGGWVEVRVDATGGRVAVEVEDSGSGVPRELRERVFEPFFTTKPPGAGTGLGLSLARTIVHRHGGVLEIRERGPRSVFVIELSAQSNVVGTAKAV